VIGTKIPVVAIFFDPHFFLAWNPIGIAALGIRYAPGSMTGRNNSIGILALGIRHEVATISRLLRIVGLFCRI